MLALPRPAVPRWASSSAIRRPVELAGDQLAVDQQSQDEDTQDKISEHRFSI